MQGDRRGDKRSGKYNEDSGNRHNGEKGGLRTHRSISQGVVMVMVKSFKFESEETYDITMAKSSHELLMLL